MSTPLTLAALRPPPASRLSRLAIFALGCAAAIALPAAHAQAAAPSPSPSEQARSEWVDRVVASVNGSPILWSDVEQEVRLQALMSARPVGDITIEERNSALDRLIDQMIVEQQIEQIGVNADTAAQEKAEEQHVAQNLADLRALYDAAPSANLSSAEADAQWRQVLASYGLTPAQVEARLDLQVEHLDFINLRFRPGQQITNRQVRDYYNNVFVPEMKKRNAEAPPLATVAPRIQQILLEQAVNQSLTEWLNIVRAQANIWRAEPFAHMTPIPAPHLAAHPAADQQVLPPSRTGRSPASRPPAPPQPAPRADSQTAPPDAPPPSQPKKQP
jgi:hypothetical protein